MTIYSLAREARRARLALHEERTCFRRSRFAGLISGGSGGTIFWLLTDWWVTGVGALIVLGPMSYAVSLLCFRPRSHRHADHGRVAARSF
jgi:hypothetical protein